MGCRMADYPLQKSSTVPVRVEGFKSHDRLYQAAMPDGDMNLIRSPDERSGPAILDREPILLPEQRKRLVDRIRDIGR